ncbi:MAG: ABC transporter permease [Chitinophagaceae bacterium]|nr:ABC transporter permease [Chitinophagaceae bacterium]
MPAPYNQITAMLAITRASFRSIFRSPSAVIFSFAFPLIFILVFGFLGGSGSGSIFKIAIEAGSDSTNALYDSLVANRSIRIVTYDTKSELESDLKKGRITGVVSIEKNTSQGAAPQYLFRLKSTTASSDKYPQFLVLVDGIINKVSNAVFEDRPQYARIDVRAGDIREVREYKTIDFILPGQLGFSLLSAGVFGVAFLFFNLRQTLVLKRFFATPINRGYIILGEGLSRVLFQMITSVTILGMGYLFFGFTLEHGIVTFLELLVLSFLGLMVFMGFGFIISGIAKTESTIPPLANIITLPQFLLAGTFFSIEAFPKWLQPVCRVLPLTHLNDAMRKVAFEGAHLQDCIKQIGIIILWGILAYVLAIKFFRWE